MSASPPFRFGTPIAPATPVSLKAQMQKAAALAEKGDLAAATRQYAEILETRPNQPDALYFLGMIAFSQGKHQICIELLSQSLEAKLSQQVPKALFCLATALQMLGRQADAVPYLRKLLRLDRNHQAAQKSLALAYFSQGMLAEAIEHFKKALTLKPSDAQAHSDMGAALFAHGQVAEAEAAYRRALTLRPELDHTRYNLGSALQALGRFDDALATYAQMIAAQPDHALAYLRYVQCKKMNEQDVQMLGRLDELTRQAHADPMNRINALFALGKIHDDLQHYDQAFGYYREANLLNRPNNKFDRQQLADETSAHIDFFSKEFFAAYASFGLRGAEVTPVFIVGMPRSGTTLLDQILSSHSQVSSAGEQNFWMQQPSILPGEHEHEPLTQQGIAETAEHYLRFLRGVAPAAPRMIDKLPHNFLRLGMIRLCFPEARIIHCRRDPLDTCLSMFFQKFISTHPYASDLDDLAFAYEQYQRLMAHWKEVMPEQILDVQYEDVVANQTGQSRKMLAFCGLEWEDGCLDFQGNRRAVMTASNWQVRQPINNKAVARWKHYRHHLGPLERLQETVGNAAIE